MTQRRRRYRLSHRQAKELPNGKRLLIAVPDDPAISHLAPRARATHLLEIPAGAWVVSVYTGTIQVDRAEKTTGLSATLGQIVHHGSPIDPLDMDVLIVEIVAKKYIRGHYPLQWPNG